MSKEIESHFICCMNLDTRELQHFKVPYSVSVFIRQLEHKVYKLENPNWKDEWVKV